MTKKTGSPSSNVRRLKNRTRVDLRDGDLYINGALWATSDKLEHQPATKELHFQALEIIAHEKWLPGTCRRLTGTIFAIRAFDSLCPYEFFHVND